MHCTQCGQRLGEGARFCTTCGAPVRSAARQADPPAEMTDQTIIRPIQPQTQARAAAHDQQARVQPAWAALDERAAPHPRLDVTTARSGEHESRGGARGKLFAAAGALALIAVAGGAYLVLNGRGNASGGGSLDAGSYGVVGFDSQPSLKWQKSLQTLAPELGCTADTTPNCSVTGVAVNGDEVVLLGTNRPMSEMLAVSKSSGTATWHAQAPAGQLFSSCQADTSTAWCLSQPASDTNDSASGNSDGTQPDSTLSSYDLTSGKQLGSTALSGSGGGASLSPVSGGSVIVTMLAAPPTNATFPEAVAKYDVADRRQWTATVNVTAQGDGGAGASWAINHDGKVYLAYVESAGQVVGFDLSSGAPIAAMPGHVVMVASGHLVTQVGSSSIQVDGKPIAQQGISYYTATDSVDAPLLATMSPQDGSGASSGGQISVLDPSNPSKIRFVTTATPLAYCNGMLFARTGSDSSGSLEAMDPHAGTIKWQHALTSYGSVYCTDGAVVVGDGSTLVALDDNGTQKWMAVIPANSYPLVGGTDQDGLVLQSGDAGSGTVISYLK